MTRFINAVRLWWLNYRSDRLLRRLRSKYGNRLYPYDDNAGIPTGGEHD